MRVCFIASEKEVWIEVENPTSLDCSRLCSLRAYGGSTVSKCFACRERFVVGIVCMVGLVRFQRCDRGPCLSREVGLGYRDQGGCRFRLERRSGTASQTSPNHSLKPGGSFTLIGWDCASVPKKTHTGAQTAPSAIPSGRTHPSALSWNSALPASDWTSMSYAIPFSGSGSIMITTSTT